MPKKDPQLPLTTTQPSDERSSRLILILPSSSGPRRVRQAIAGFLLAVWHWAVKMTGMTRHPGFNEFLSYEPKRDKVVEGVLLLLERASADGHPMSIQKLTTAMFLADKGHLDAYGRPVFFDNYVATVRGPEGVAAVEMLDPNFDWASTGIDGAPWSIEHSPSGTRPSPSRAPNMRRLSETDVEALESALAMVTTLDTDQLHLFTHRQAAYAAAWNDGAGAGTRLDPRLIPDRRDDEMIDDLLYASRHAYVAPYR